MSASDVRRDYAPGRVNGAVVGALVGVIAAGSIVLGLLGGTAYFGILWLVTSW
ncbi:hypothetical protein IT072_02600 [Leifsonia sp. ZF2019]|uniref:hypothetical protein n=1 Tax=Leifsonia sp. ZF2019 TaxID=2781978 RepID=UPI001CBE687B|nr:hypothetical protein [Leifsonia sp. ZF2019]UAJ79987.1 hypothetical protein IT072_02600 [Leifsonia sp. ZF2019]